MNSELEQEVHFELSSFGLGPIRIILINFRALSAATDDWGKPVFLPEEYVGYDGGEGVEAGVVTEFEYVGGFFVPGFTLVLVVYELVYLISHEVVVTVLGNLRLTKWLTKMNENPTATQTKESTAKT